MSGLKNEGPFWVAIALVLLAFRTGASLRQKPVPTVNDAARLLVAAENRAQRSEMSSRMWANTREVLLHRVLQIQPLTLVARERLIAIKWNRYQEILFWAGRSSESDLAEIERLSTVPGFMERPKGDTCLIETLTEIEMSRLAPDVAQAWRWLDKAQQTTEVYARDLPEMGGGPSRLASLKYVTGRADLQRYLLGRDSNDLTLAVRSFWAAIALDPASIASRYYLACALRFEGKDKTAMRIARSVLRMPNSPRQSLEGPSAKYRRRINALLSARK